MRPSDIDEVMEIEHQSFPTPWMADAYRYEIQHNVNAHYYVIRPQVELPVSQRNNGWRGKIRQFLGSKHSHSSVPILGYVGFWLVAGEAHISTIAVHPGVRRRGIGELLLVQVIEDALEFEAEFVTLEVRISNHAAQNLYEKYGFKREGCRRGYYSDTREDAWIMTVQFIEYAEYHTIFREKKRQLLDKLLHMHVNDQPNQASSDPAAYD